MTAENGIATFDNVSIDSAGTLTLSASDDDVRLTGTISDSFTISAAEAAQLAFTQIPACGNAGYSLSPGAIVAVQDRYGNTVTTDSSTVTLTLSSGTFDSGATTTATAVNGIATFNSLIIDSTGNYTLTASDGTLTGTQSSSITIFQAGDTNRDGVLNSLDIDAIYKNFGAPATSQWKVATDGLPVDQADVTYELLNYFHTNYGDANLDGKIDFLDFQVLLDHWQVSGPTVGWAQADFNGDGTVDFLDFQMLLDYWNPGGWNAYNLSPETWFYA